MMPARARAKRVAVVQDKGSPMDLGLIGLERIGTNRVRRLLRAGHQCIAYGIHPQPVWTPADAASSRDGE